MKVRQRKHQIGHFEAAREKYEAVLDIEMRPLCKKHQALVDQYMKADPVRTKELLEWAAADSAKMDAEVAAELEAESAKKKARKSKKE